MKQKWEMTELPDCNEQLLAELEEAKRRGELPVVSEKLDRCCRALIRNTFQQIRRQERRRGIRRAIGQAVVVGVALVCVCALSVCSVEASRTPVFNILLGGKEQYSTIIMEHPEETLETSVPSQQIEERKQSPLVGLVPEGYEVVNLHHHQGEAVYCSYSNRAGDTISFAVRLLGGTCNFDTENARVSKVKIMGHDGVGGEGRIPVLLVQFVRRTFLSFESFRSL